jgi:hypothetical protein
MRNNRRKGSGMFVRVFLHFDRIYGMNRIREMNGLNSAAKGMVYRVLAARVRNLIFGSR